jgi:hypothetical protein
MTTTEAHSTPRHDTAAPVKKRRVVDAKVTANARPTPRPSQRPVIDGTSKQERMLLLLRRPHGATVAELMDVANWQAHSIRGFLAGTIKKKLSLPLVSSKDRDGVRRYRIDKKRNK